MQVITQGLSTADVKARLQADGPNEVQEAKEHPLLRFAVKFWGLSAWMIELIAGLSAVLGKWTDFGIAIGLLLVNAVLGFLQEQRASLAVTALRRRLQITARALRDGKWQPIEARELVRGDVIRIRAGDVVPADAKILEGSVSVDQSSLTGESREVERNLDETLYSGAAVREGEATAEVSATGTRTYYGRATELVQSARPKLHVEEVIGHVVRWLFLIVGTLVAVTLVVSLVGGVKLLEILPLSLILLMSAVPVALPVMFTVSMAIGSVTLARHGVLITRLSAAEDAANMDVLCADKTGTLTMNRLSFVSGLPQPGFDENDVIRLGALASNAADQDPIDAAFLSAASSKHLLDASGKVISFVPFSPKIRRTEAVVETPSGTLHVMKGALRTLAEAQGLSAAEVSAIEAHLVKETRTGYRAIAVARAENDGPLQLVGVGLLADTLRPDSNALIQELQALGVAVKLLTGDALPVAQEIGRQLGLPRIVAASRLQEAGQFNDTELTTNSDGFAEIFPEDKFLVVQSLQKAGHVAGMTGDGINDAPALRQAEVGIAVHGASDVAKGAASAVLTTEGLGGIVELVKNGRSIYQRVLTWIINKVSRTILKAGFVVAAFLVTGKFVISALGMVLVVFMTDFVKIALSTDHVRPSQQPESWHIAPLIRIAVVLGVLMLIEALGLLALAWHWFDLGHNDGALKTFSFQMLLFFAIASVISVRERRAFWFSRPSMVFATALIADAIVGLLIGFTGLAELSPLPLSETATIIAFAALFPLALNDIVKVALIKRLVRYKAATRSNARLQA